MSIELTVKLPEDLFRDGQEFDLFDQQTIIQLFKDELDRRVNEMVNEEIHAYRSEKRNQ